MQEVNELKFIPVDQLMEQKFDVEQKQAIIEYETLKLERDSFEERFKKALGIVAQKSGYSETEINEFVKAILMSEDQSGEYSNHLSRFRKQTKQNFISAIKHLENYDEQIKDATVKYFENAPKVDPNLIKEIKSGALAIDPTEIEKKFNGKNKYEIHEGHIAYDSSNKSPVLNKEYLDALSVESYNTSEFKFKQDPKRFTHNKFDFSISVEDERKKAFSDKVRERNLEEVKALKDKYKEINEKKINEMQTRLDIPAARELIQKKVFETYKKTDKDLLGSKLIDKADKLKDLNSMLNAGKYGLIQSQETHEIFEPFNKEIFPALSEAQKLEDEIQKLTNAHDQGKKNILENFFGNRYYLESVFHDLLPKEYEDPTSKVAAEVTDNDLLKFIIHKINAHDDTKGRPIEESINVNNFDKSDPEFLSKFSRYLFELVDDHKNSKPEIIADMVKDAKNKKAATKEASRIFDSVVDQMVNVASKFSEDYLSIQDGLEEIPKKQAALERFNEIIERKTQERDTYARSETTYTPEMQEIKGKIEDLESKTDDQVLEDAREETYNQGEVIARSFVKKAETLDKLLDHKTLSKEIQNYRENKKNSTNTEITSVLEQIYKKEFDEFYQTNAELGKVVTEEDFFDDIALDIATGTLHPPDVQDYLLGPEDERKLLFETLNRADPNLNIQSEQDFVNEIAEKKASEDRAQAFKDFEKNSETTTEDPDVLRAINPNAKENAVAVNRTDVNDETYSAPGENLEYSMFGKGSKKAHDDYLAKKQNALTDNFNKNQFAIKRAGQSAQMQATPIALTTKNNEGEYERNLFTSAISDQNVVDAKELKKKRMIYEKTLAEQRMIDKRLDNVDPNNIKLKTRLQNKQAELNDSVRIVKEDYEQLKTKVLKSAHKGLIKRSQDSEQAFSGYINKDAENVRQNVKKITSDLSGSTISEANKNIELHKEIALNKIREKRESIDDIMQQLNIETENAKQEFAADPDNLDLDERYKILQKKRSELLTQSIKLQKKENEIQSNYEQVLNNSGFSGFDEDFKRDNSPNFVNSNKYLQAQLKRNSFYNNLKPYLPEEYWEEHQNTLDMIKNELKNNKQYLKEVSKNNKALSTPSLINDVKHRINANPSLTRDFAYTSELENKNFVTSQGFSSRDFYNNEKKYINNEVQKQNDFIKETAKVQKEGQKALRLDARNAAREEKRKLRELKRTQADPAPVVKKTVIPLRQDDGLPGPDIYESDVIGLGQKFVNQTSGFVDDTNEFAPKPSVVNNPKTPTNVNGEAFVQTPQPKPGLLDKIKSKLKEFKDQTITAVNVRKLNKLVKKDAANKPLIDDQEAFLK